MILLVIVDFTEKRAQAKVFVVEKHNYRFWPIAFVSR